MVKAMLCAALVAQAASVASASNWFHHGGRGDDKGASVPGGGASVPGMGGMGDRLYDLGDHCLLGHQGFLTGGLGGGLGGFGMHGADYASIPGGGSSVPGGGGYSHPWLSHSWLDAHPFFMGRPMQSTASMAPAKAESTASSAASSSATSSSAVEAADDTPGCIVAAAQSNPDLSILAAAVEASGSEVVDLLSSPDNVLTVFAPTDAAFETLLGALDLTAEQLLGNSTLLLGVLSYHLVPDVAAKAADLSDGQDLVTALGPTVPLTVQLEGGNVVLDAVGSEATVIVPDIEVCSSVVHVIDEVLLPVEA